MDPAWVSLIGNYGFPIALAIYLLIRFEKRIEKLTDSIDTLKEVIQKK
ncbi:YvrJ family protein [Bacillus sp. CGMCC 1.60114]